MDNKNFSDDDVNRLINSVWNENVSPITFSLRLMFENRLEELNISENQAIDNLNIEYRTLNGILDGNLKRFELVSLLKIGHFLEIPQNEIVEMYTKYVSERHKDDLEQTQKRTFIFNNFDLPMLKTIGVIDSIKDFDHIEQKLNSVFGLKSILDYNIEDIGSALSSTLVKPKNDKSRKYFQNKARSIFLEINNSNRYDKQALIEYFPKIRWHSIDLENGIINVIKSLFELGVTVIYQPKVPNLQMRGATFAVNDKPCIVLTDYRGTYPTLWFALLHELFHVLFDWDEILVKRYHLSDEENDLFVVRQKEEEANEFAREFLFPKHKIELVKHRINQPIRIKEFALENHVHPSIVYANYAYSTSSEDESVWARFDKLIRPPMQPLIKKLSNNMSHNSTTLEFAEYYKNNLLKPLEDEKPK